MTTEIGSIEYRLPRTECVVAAKRRKAVTSRQDGSYLEPVVDISVVPSLVADAVRVLRVEQSWGENIDLDITFDAQGMLTVVNSSSSVDFTPIIDLAGKALALAASGGVLALGIAKAKAPEKAETLEKQWEAAQAALAAHLQALNLQSKRLLEVIAKQDMPFAGIVEAGKALEAVQAQMASIAAARRLWMAGRETTKSLVLHLAPEDLCLVEGGFMPDRLSGATVSIPPMQAKLAKEIGCLVAVRDPARPQTTSRGKEVGADTLVTRVPRRAEIAVYLGEVGSDWVLDEDSVQTMNLTDTYCEERNIDLNRRGIAFSLHPDGAIKSFGIKKTSMIPGVAKSIIGAADSIQSGRESARKAAEAAADKAKPKADPGASAAIGTEYEFLAVIHGRGKSPS